MKLRPLRRSDLEGLSVWLPEVAALAGCATWASAGALESASRKQNVLTSADALRVFLAFKVGAPAHDAAQIDFLAVALAERRRGVGGRAALALEQRLRGKVRRICALVPASNGLALYFWLRLGYRPLAQDGLPAKRSDPPSVWMVRGLA